MEISAKISICVILTTLIVTVFGQSYTGRQRQGPGPRRRCRWGSAGQCDINGYCPSGSTCRRGRCCRSRPEQNDLCRESQIHREECGGFVGVQCASGYTCRRRGGSSLGICCPIEQPNNDICGESKIHRASCGGFVGPCAVGFTCEPVSERVGICCPSQRGSCPPPSGRFSTCQFVEEVNCIDDSSCRRGQLCCQDGCGSVCKNAVFEPTPTTYQSIKL